MRRPECALLGTWLPLDLEPWEKRGTRSMTMGRLKIGLKSHSDFAS